MEQSVQTPKTGFRQLRQADPTYMSVENALERCPVEARELVPLDLSLAEGQHLMLDDRLGWWSKACLPVVGANLSQFKAMVGFDDDTIPEMRGVEVDLSHAPAPAELLAGMHTGDHRMDEWVRKIGLAYIFGRSTDVADYREVIEKEFRLQDLRVFRFGHVTLPEGSILEVTGCPKLLIMDQIHFNGGSLHIKTHLRCGVGVLAKGVNNS